MPNGKPGDNPITDLLNYGQHPFPSDIEQMVRELARINPQSLNELGWEPFDWEKGKDLDMGRQHLKDLLEKYRGKQQTTVE